MLKITQIKSTIGYKPKAKRTLSALGLKRINHYVEKSDTPQIRGMLRIIDYLIKVEEVQVRDQDIKKELGSKVGRCL